ncbi:MAG: cyclic nucleotide-gated ion channel [Siculibacillus sp.]
MPSKTRRASWKRRIFEILEVPPLGDPVALLVERLIVVMIVVNVATVILETVKELKAAYEPIFLAIEVGTVVIFAAEYLLRVWISDEHVPLKRYGRVGARIHYVLSPAAIIDFLSVAPTLVGFAFGVYDVNVFAVFRLLRFLKLARYSAGMSSLFNAVASERRALFASAVVMAGLVITAASLMHWIEGAVQPDRFGSIPAAMYWAVTTLTTVGYGDMVPVTPAGRLLAGIVMLFGFCMFALPVGIIATAFAREIHSRDFVVTWGMVARVPLFSQLSAAEIADVMRLLRAQTVEAGTVITAAGDPAHSMYFISSGKVEIALPHEKLHLADGAFFGEIAVLRRARRSADVIALTHCRLLLLDAEDLQYLMQKKSEIAEHIRAVARERIAREAITPRGDIALEELDDVRGSPDDWL